MDGHRQLNSIFFLQNNQEIAKISDFADVLIANKSEINEAQVERVNYLPVVFEFTSREKLPLTAKAQDGATLVSEAKPDELQKALRESLASLQAVENAYQDSLRRLKSEELAFDATESAKVFSVRLICQFALKIKFAQDDLRLATRASGDKLHYQIVKTTWCRKKRALFMRRTRNSN